MAKWQGIAALPILSCLITAPTFASPLYENSTTPGTTAPSNNTSQSAGSGLSFALACNAAKHSWEYAIATELVTITTRTETLQSVETEISTTTRDKTYTITHLRNTTAYTLCDGYPRYDGNTTVSVDSTVLEYTKLHTATIINTLATISTPTPAPSCVIGNSDCALLQTRFSSDMADYNSSTSAYDTSSSSLWSSLSKAKGISAANSALFSVPYPSYTGILTPLCGSSSLSPATSVSVGDPVCFEPQASVQLLYWPVS
jgi:hypothetical protein